MTPAPRPTPAPTFTVICDGPPTREGLRAIARLLLAAARREIAEERERDQEPPTQEKGTAA